jgi:two-component system cell cycle sensor histidine kinase/response regulator CckA
VSGSGRSTVRLAAEIEALRGQLAAVSGEADVLRRSAWIEETRRVESLGALVGGIAHDFNNLLTPILGEASLLLLDLPEDSPLRARLERIRAAAQRGAALTA